MKQKHDESIQRWLIHALLLPHEPITLGFIPWEAASGAKAPFGASLHIDVANAGSSVSQYENGKQPASKKAKTSR